MLRRASVESCNTVTSLGPFCASVCVGNMTQTPRRAAKLPAAAAAAAAAAATAGDDDDDDDGDGVAAAASAASADAPRA